MHSLLEQLAAAQWLVTSYLCGLIWTIQLVHYPSFEWIVAAQFEEFHRFHSRRITAIVMLPMVVELAVAIALLQYEPLWFWAVNLGSVMAIWAVTFFISVPLHNRLQSGKNLQSIAKLVATNWLRTALWSARALWLLAGALLFHVVF